MVSKTPVAEGEEEALIITVEAPVWLLDRGRQDQTSILLQITSPHSTHLLSLGAGGLNEASPMALRG